MWSYKAGQAPAPRVRYSTCLALPSDLDPAEKDLQFGAAVDSLQRKADEVSLASSDDESTIIGSLSQDPTCASSESTSLRAYLDSKSDGFLAEEQSIIEPIRQDVVHQWPGETANVFSVPC